MRDSSYREKRPVVWAFRYKGQPRSEWPQWLKVHYSGPFNVPVEKQIGRVAVAVKENGRKQFWRWFNPGDFREQFELVSRSPQDNPEVRHD